MSVSEYIVLRCRTILEGGVSLKMTGEILLFDSFTKQTPPLSVVRSLGTRVCTSAR